MSKQSAPGQNSVLACGHCAEYEQVNRRTFLANTFTSASSLLLGNAVLTVPRADWMPRIRLAPPHVGPRGDTLVCIFLRGGADGLNMVVPHGEDAYYQRRPALAIPRPDDHQAEFKAIDLDGFFGLHPSLTSLHDIYNAGDLALIHASGSPDETRSHFEAMALMERGATTGSDFSGWLARHLATLDTGNDSALRAVAIDDMLPASLTGAVAATALKSIGSHHLGGREEERDEMQDILSLLYSQQDDLLASAANQTLASIEVLSRVDMAHYQPRGRAYPERDFGMAMKTVAQLIRAAVGVEVACVNMGGWDTHAVQGSGQGAMPNLMETLSAGLTAFYEDLQDGIENVTVVVMSEFGRRVKQNAARGTDHGQGNMMMVLGGGINGGQVYADWPGLQPEQLSGPGDLAITTDYRAVLGEVILKRLNNPRVAEIFPRYSFEDIGLVVART